MLPLEGVLVVAIEHAVAAPTCTLRLADAGARVIKIERAEGETARHYDKSVNGTSAYFAWLNRGKESAVLNIKQEGDRQLLETMIAKADVFVQNLAPGAAGRLDLAAKDVVARHSRLVAVDIAGYPQDSSYRDMRAYDMLIQAESGVCSVTGTADTPVKVGVSIADVMTGMNAHAAILEALMAREVSGKGQAIEIDMFATMADMMSVPLLHHIYGKQETPRTGLSHAAIYPYNSIACRDGEIVIVVQNPAEWRRFCSGVLEQPELADDPRFADNPTRVKNRKSLQAIMEEVFGKLERKDAIARLEAHNLAWSNVSSVDEVADHPALRRIPGDVPGGPFEAIASPVRRVIKGGPVPGLGEHTDAIRGEFG